MNQIDSYDAFEDLVREALRVDAERAPASREAWSDVGYAPATHMDTWRPRPRRVLLAAGLTAAAATLVGIVIIAPSLLSITEPATEAGQWLPAGTEFPSIDLGPAISVPSPPAVEALTRRIGIDGHPDLIVARSVSYMSGETAEELNCTWENGSGGCRSASAPTFWSISITSSVDNSAGETNLWLLEGLPDNVAYVAYATSDQKLWQRPISGLVAFPYTSSDPVVIGYDYSGAEVGRYSNEFYFELAQSYAPPPVADLTDAEMLQLSDLTGNTMTSCLAESGGRISAGGVATFAEDANQVAIWDNCVKVVQATVAARVMEISPDMREPAAGYFGDQDEPPTTGTIP